MERLIRGLAELAEAVPEAVPRVVLNRCRSSVGIDRDEAVAAVERFAGAHGGRRAARGPRRDRSGLASRCAARRGGAALGVACRPARTRRGAAFARGPRLTPPAATHRQETATREEERPRTRRKWRPATRATVPHSVRQQRPTTRVKPPRAGTRPRGGMTRWRHARHGRGARRRFADPAGRVRMTPRGERSFRVPDEAEIQEQRGAYRSSAGCDGASADGATGTWESRVARSRGFVELLVDGVVQRIRTRPAVTVRLIRCNAVAATAFIIGGALFTLGGAARAVLGRLADDDRTRLPDRRLLLLQSAPTRRSCRS